jgi:hypothetical protein
VADRDQPDVLQVEVERRVGVAKRVSGDVAEGLAGVVDRAGFVVPEAVVPESDGAQREAEQEDGRNRPDTQ